MDSLEELFKYHDTVNHYVVKEILFGADDSPRANREFEKLLKSGKLKPVPGTNAYRKEDVVNLIRGEGVERRRLMENFENLLKEILTEIKRLREDIGVVKNAQHDILKLLRMREKEPLATK